MHFLLLFLIHFFHLLPAPNRGPKNMASRILSLMPVLSQFPLPLLLAAYSRFPRKHSLRKIFWDIHIIINAIRMSMILKGLLLGLFRFLFPETSLYLFGENTLKHLNCHLSCEVSSKLPFLTPTPSNHQMSAIHPLPTKKTDQ